MYLNRLEICVYVYEDEAVVIDKFTDCSYRGKFRKGMFYMPGYC